MFSKLRTNYRLANILARTLFVLAFMFATWRNFYESSYLVLQRFDLPMALLAAAVLGIIVQFLVPVVCGLFLNFARNQTVPAAEFCIFAYLYFAAGMATTGAILLVGWFVPVAAVWLSVIAPVVSVLLYGFLFFLRTSKLYFNDVTAVNYAKSFIWAEVMLLVVFGVLL